MFFQRIQRSLWKQIKTILSEDFFDVIMNISFVIITNYMISSSKPQCPVWSFTMQRSYNLVLMILKQFSWHRLLTSHSKNCDFPVAGNGGEGLWSLCICQMNVWLIAEKCELIQVSCEIPGWMRHFSKQGLSGWPELPLEFPGPLPQLMKFLWKVKQLNMETCIWMHFVA